MPGKAKVKETILDGNTYLSRCVMSAARDDDREGPDFNRCRESKALRTSPPYTLKFAEWKQPVVAGDRQATLTTTNQELQTSAMS